MLLTLRIRDVIAATPRARVVRIALDGHPFDYAPGQAVRRDLLLVGVDADNAPPEHLTLEPGAEIDVEGPLGSFIFPPDPEERRFLFIAGGTGIAPLRAMLRHALAIPRSQIGLLYSARTVDGFAYQEEFRALARAGRLELKETVTRDAGQDWTGVHDPATLCFICGPAAMVVEMPRLVEGLGVPRSRIRIEEWG